MNRARSVGSSIRPASRYGASNADRGVSDRAAVAWRVVFYTTLAVVVAGAGAGCGGASSSSPPAESGAGTVGEPNSSSAADGGAKHAFRWREAARASGVDWTYRNGQEAGHAAILESLGGGAALFDYDRDGRLDIWLTGGGAIDKQLATTGLPSQLFRAVEDGRFIAVADRAQVDAARFYSHGAYSADYDADGFLDLLVTGYGGLVLWHNQGDGTFVERQGEAGLADDSWSSSAAWADFNGDGTLDLYVAHYVNWSAKNHPLCELPRTGKREVCAPRAFSGLPDSLYLGRGDGTFADASRQAVASQPGKGLGVVAADVDSDGDVDVYVGNDTVENFLFVNDGRAGFEEVGLVAGVAVNHLGVPDGSMGVDVGDFNLDGRPDLWVANYEDEAFALYRNEGQGQFLHVSQSSGITALGGLFVGFGTALADFDRDGDEDIVAENGHISLYPNVAPRRQTPLLLENRAGRFVRARFAAGDYFETPFEGRGVAVGDLDRDGDLDYVGAHLNEPAALMINETPPVGPWIGVRLIGRRSNRDAIGARLTLETSVGPRMRWVKGGGSYLSQSDYGVHWGVPADAEVRQLTIAWPSGVEQTLQPRLNSWQTVVEPDVDP